jgi:DNA-binding transcriptional ArsR family regulator
VTFTQISFVYTSSVVDDQSAALAALGDHTRRAIVVFLADRPQAVGELADQLPVSRPAVSQHLRALKDAGLVSEHAVGTRRIYRLNPAGMNALRAHFELLWRRALTGPTEAADEARGKA